MESEIVIAVNFNNVKAELVLNITQVEKIKRLIERNPNPAKIQHIYLSVNE